MKITYQITACARTNVGCIRDNNEDNFSLCGQIRDDVEVPNATASVTTTDEGAFFSVCDGMGGQAHGETASLIAVRSLKGYPMDTVRQSARQNILDANAKICQEIRRSDGSRMGSTLAVLYADHGKAISVNIGDSRVYLYRKPDLRQLSEDHNEAAQLVRIGVLTKEQASADKRRHRLTQHLGMFEDELVPEPYWSEEITLCDGDRFLLCSDGITDMLTDEKIANILQTESGTQMAADSLINEALHAGGKDNLTVIVADITEIRGA